MADFVTVHEPVSLGVEGLFAVQGGIPLSDAMDAMALLLSTARGGACEMAQTCSDNDASGTAWALEHLLALAQALNTSIHSGLNAGQRNNTKPERAAP